MSSMRLWWVDEGEVAEHDGAAASDVLVFG